MAVAAWLRRLDADVLAGQGMSRRPVRAIVFAVAGALLGFGLAVGTLFAVEGAWYLVAFLYAGLPLIGGVVGAYVGARQPRR